jgi:hypothetical protein
VVSCFKLNFSCAVLYLQSVPNPAPLYMSTATFLQRSWLNVLFYVDHGKASVQHARHLINCSSLGLEDFLTYSEGHPLAGRRVLQTMMVFTNCVCCKS